MKPHRFALFPLRTVLEGCGRQDLGAALAANPGDATP